MLWSSHGCNYRRYSYLTKIFAIDLLTALKSPLEHDRKHVLRLLQLHEDQARGVITVIPSRKDRQSLVSAKGEVSKYLETEF